MQMVLLGAFLLDTLVFSLVVSFLPGYLLARGASIVVVGAIFAVYALGLLLATFPAGWLTDHIGARRVLLGGLEALLLSTLLFAVAPGLPWLFVARALQGASSAFTWTSGLALLTQLSQDQDRPHLFIRVFTATSLGMLLGPPLGGFLYTWGGFRLPFMVAAGLVLLDGAGYILFLPGHHQVRSARPGFGIILALLRHPGVCIALLATVVGMTLLSALDPSLPPLLHRQFGLQPWAIGLCFAFFVVSFIAIQSLAARVMRRARLEALMALAMLVAALAFIALGLAQSLPLLLGAMVLLSGAMAFSLAPALELLTASGQTATQAQGIAYGAIYALYNLAVAGGTLLGPILAGGLIAWAGSFAGLLWLAALPLSMAAGISALLFSPRRTPDTS
jgi:DHA1 family solute carrier family 18 vesicular amine transporter 1/2